jgi:hypothetical protein
VVANEPVTSPDQHKPGPTRAARAGAIGTVVVLLMLGLCANGGSQESQMGLVAVLVVAGLIVGYLVLDWLLRKNGLRS